MRLSNSKGRSKGRFGAPLMSMLMTIFMFGLIITKDVTKTLERVVNILFFFFGAKIKGYRTVILMIVTAILSAWAFIHEQGLYGLLCDLGEVVKFLSFFCTIEEEKFYAWVLGFISALGLILRKLSDEPVGVSPETYLKTSALSAQPPEVRAYVAAVEAEKAVAHRKTAWIGWFGLFWLGVIVVAAVLFLLGAF